MDEIGHRVLAVAAVSLIVLFVLAALAMAGVLDAWLFVDESCLTDMMCESDPTFWRRGD